VEVFSTGVAKGRDRLDSAISTSALRGEDIVRFGPRSAGDVLRTLPGLRVESGIGEGNNNYTVRGLPLAAGGSKYMQIQEDGLPLLEFGDLFNAGSDVYLRNDFNVAAIEVIRAARPPPLHRIAGRPDQLHVQDRGQSRRRGAGVERAEL
jgi:hypothetical protein